MAAEDRLIVFENVSKFYGDVLGVNRVTLSIEPGITSLVGPNGAGKTTLMNLMAGLLRPTNNASCSSPRGHRSAACSQHRMHCSRNACAKVSA